METMTNDLTRESLIEYLEAAVAGDSWRDRAHETARREIAEAGYKLVTHNFEDGPDGRPLTVTYYVESREVIMRQTAEEYLADIVPDGVDVDPDTQLVHEDRVIDWYEERHPEDADPTPLTGPWSDIIDIDNPGALRVLLDIAKG